MIRVDLDSVWKARNASEGRRVNRASACGLERVGDGQVIALLCRDLIDAGHDERTPVEVWRGETRCFMALPLYKWADGKALTGEQPEQLRRRK